MRNPREFVASLVAERDRARQPALTRANWPEMMNRTWRHEVKLAMPRHLFASWAFHFSPQERWEFVAIARYREYA